MGAPLSRPAKRWPFRPTDDWADGFQRGYAEALFDLSAAAADREGLAESLRAVVNLVEGDPIVTAEEVWVGRDGSEG